MINSVLEKLRYRLALRRIGKRTVGAPPDDLSRRRLLVVLPQQVDLFDAALTLVGQIELPPDRIQLLWIGDELPSNSMLSPYDVHHVSSREFSWLQLPLSKVCREAYTPEPDVAIDLNIPFVLPAAYVAARSPAYYRIGIHHPEAEPFRDILLRYEGQGKEVYLALRRILYSIEPAILPMQPMSTKVFY